MPIYEFNCRKCNRNFEKFVFSSKQEGAMRCPGCGSAEVEKIMSSFSCSSGSQADGRAAAGSSCSSGRFG
ncbi:MAG TPA: zinc ribbon domain-containing protein [Thermodesulfobacteriaceae bacterium]|nr:zinc ribbon domain-containing protein [Thermodesulfobacteriaceae bacterium]